MLQAADLTIRLNPADDVVIARVEIPKGTTLVKEGNVSMAAWSSGTLQSRTRRGLVVARRWQSAARRTAVS